MKKIIYIACSFLIVCLIISCKVTNNQKTDTTTELKKDSIARAEVLRQLTEPTIELEPESQEKIIINKN